MSNYLKWLPSLIMFDDYQGDWERYLEAIYAVFKHDFVDTKPIFQGRRLGVKRLPLSDGKEATFWHMIQKGEFEEDRIPDFRRCERIRWPRSIIEHHEEPEIKIWRNKRNHEDRICLWFCQKNYLVILADRGRYILPWTAYLVEQPHRQQKLQKEYEKFKKVAP